jgi:hypothetical protein
VKAADAITTLETIMKDLFALEKTKFDEAGVTALQDRLRVVDEV